MSLYLIFPLFACIASSALASAIYAREPRHPTSRYAGLLMVGVAFWSACEVIWNTRDDAAVVHFFVSASILGWAWIGPLTLRLLLAITGAAAPRLRRALPALTAVPLFFVLIDWLTPWLRPAVVRTSWGWAYELAPAAIGLYAYHLACIGVAVALGWSRYRTSDSPTERSQARWIGFGIGVPLVVASLTDGILPMLGVQTPRLGTVSLTVLGGTIVWSIYQRGYSLLAPGTFAREILETLPDGVAMLRQNGRIHSVNTTMAELLGCAPDRLGGADISGFIDALDSELCDELSEVECQLRSVSGTMVPVSLSSTVLRDRRGSAIGIVLVARDLREVVALRGRLVVSGRLAAVGELAAGIAHEINNPLAYVRANLGLLRQHWDTLGSELLKSGASPQTEAMLAEGEEMIDESLQGVDRTTAIVRDVKGLARVGHGERELADLNQLLDGVLRMAAPQLRKTSVVEKQYGRIPLVVCAPQELQQVFLNLVLNAGQAIEESGTIRVRTEVEPGAVLTIIEDDGCGVAPEMIDRIFDPFFTTKPVGEGTGLGLGIAYEIVRNHGGEISVDSAPGRGASFKVRLPVPVDTIESD